MADWAVTQPVNLGPCSRGASFKAPAKSLRLPCLSRTAVDPQATFVSLDGENGPCPFRVIRSCRQGLGASDESVPSASVNYSARSAKVFCGHSDYIEAVEGIRAKLKGVGYFVALEGAGDGWINYETTLAKHHPAFDLFL